MTNNDDWARFCLRMWEQDWVHDPDDDEVPDTGRWFNGLAVYWPNGDFRLGAGPISNVGDWRTWLEAGQTPSPF